MSTWDFLKAGNYDAVSAADLKKLSDSKIRKFLVMTGFHDADDVKANSAAENLVLAAEIIEGDSSSDEVSEESETSSSDDEGDAVRSTDADEARTEYRRVHGRDMERENESARIKALRSLRRAESKSRSRSRSRSRSGGSTSERRKRGVDTDTRQYAEYGDLSGLMAKIRARRGQQA